jgi:integrase
MSVARTLRAVSASGMNNKIGTPAPWVDPLTGYDSWLRASHTPLSTRKIRNYHLRRFASDTRAAPTGVTLDMIVDHLGRPGWSASTRNSVRSTLRSFYRWAEIHSLVARSPARHAPKVRASIGVPRPAEEAAIAGALERAEPRVFLMIRLGASAGLRCCEIATVRGDSVVSTAKGWALRVRGKGNKTRVVPVPADLASLVSRHDGYVFDGQIDGHLSAAYVSKLISRALPPGVSAHMLRHRYGTRAFRASHNLRAVQELLGHASVATTQIYTRVDDDMLHEAALAAA